MVALQRGGFRDACIVIGDRPEKKREKVDKVMSPQWSYLKFFPEALGSREANQTRIEAAEARENVELILLPEIGGIYAEVVRFVRRNLHILSLDVVCIRHLREMYSSRGYETV